MAVITKGIIVSSVEFSLRKAGFVLQALILSQIAENFIMTGILYGKNRDFTG